MHKPSPQTIIWLSIALMGTVAIGIGSWWVSQKPQPVPTPVVNANTNTDTAGPTVSGTVIPPAKTDCADELDTECWNTYRNEEYGFSFRFPVKNTSITKESSGSVSLSLITDQQVSDDWKINFPNSPDKLQYNIAIKKITDKQADDFILFADKFQDAKLTRAMGQMIYSIDYHKKIDNNPDTITVFRSLDGAWGENDLAIYSLFKENLWVIDFRSIPPLRDGDRGFDQQYVDLFFNIVETVHFIP